MTTKKKSRPRTLPHNLDAETSVIGGCIIDNARIPVARETITAPMFFRKAHELIWSVVDDLDRKNIPVDFTTMLDELDRRGHVHEVGGPVYLSGLIDGVPRSTNVEAYAQLVKDYWLRRQIIFAANQLLASGYDAVDEPVSSIVDQAENVLLELSRAQFASDGYVSAENWMVGTMQLVKQLAEHKSAVTGVPTGFPRVDFLTRGLQPGNLVILAGRPSMGKTSLALQLAREAARHGTTGVLSIEMSKNELGMRAISLESKVNLHSILTGDLDDKTGPAVFAAGDSLEQSGLRIDESPWVTAEQVRSRAKRLAAAEPLNMLVIDYLQLMDTRQAKGENREQAIARTTRMLKAIAKELHIPIVLLSQLSRANEARSDKRPMLSDLRESGAIEQDADVVLFIHRPEYYDRKPENKGLAELIIAKQRNGPVATVEMFFEEKQTRFYPYSMRPQT